MAQEIENLVVKISADTEDLQAGASKAGDSMADMAKGMALVTAAAGALKTMILDSVAAYAEAERSAARLEAVYKATGGAVGIASDALLDYSSVLEKSTGVSDESIQDMMSVLLTFKNVQGETFEQASALALDLSAVMGGDLKGAALQLGKALEDPVTGMNALRRSGISFSEDQQAVIKGLVETNRLAEAQAMILKTVEGQVGGTAAALGTTLSGSFDKVNNAFGNLQEVIGQSLAPALQGVANALTVVVEWAQKAPQPLISLAAGFGTVGGAIVILIPTLKLFGVTLNASVAGPIGLVTAGIAVLIIELANLNAQFEQQKARVQTFADIDKKIKAGTASITEYQQAIRLIGEDVRKFEQAKNSANPVDMALNASGQLDRKIAEYTARQRELIQVEENLRRTSNGNTQARTRQAEATRIATELEAKRNEQLKLMQDTFARTNEQFEKSTENLTLQNDITKDLTVSNEELTTSLEDGANQLNNMAEPIESFTLYGDLLEAKLMTMQDAVLALSDALINGLGSAFYAMGEAMVQGEDGWKAFASAAIKSIAGIVKALGDQLAAMAAADLAVGIAMSSNVVTAGAAGGFYTSAAIKAGGAAAAWAAAGALSAYASSDAFASGTNYAPGGMALVGEQGPEMVRLPQGSQVIPNHYAKGGMGGGVNITINSPTAVNPFVARTLLTQTMRQMAFEGAI